MNIERPREVTVLIVIPSEVATVGLTVALSSRSELHVLATAYSLDHGLAALRKQAPEVVVIAPEWIPAVEQFLPDAPIRTRLIAFGSKPHLGANADATARVACGYVSYLTPGRTYLPLIDAVSRCHLPSMDTKQMLCRSCPIRQSLQPPKPNLTVREMQVFVAIGKGFGASDLAVQMGISVKTVESHRESIKSKLALGSAWEMNAIAADWCRGGSS
ncbi:LuxR C-terminal-related transcriptional regulator [Tahibacter aquaticus]|jgi:DNA-binding NarL/FixJ family response regulator|nr:LuxR C-terminal-related transcriptional regulator [Tahibacter aquaticus]